MHLYLQQVGLDVTDRLCDVIFWLDILLSFRTGYAIDGVYISDSMSMIRNYARSRLPLDPLRLTLGPRLGLTPRLMPRRILRPRLRRVAA